jgi:hypothetical protein
VQGGINMSDQLSCFQIIRVRGRNIRCPEPVRWHGLLSSPGGGSHRVFCCDDHLALVADRLPSTIRGRIAPKDPNPHVKSPEPHLGNPLRRRPPLQALGVGPRFSSGWTSPTVPAAPATASSRRPLPGHLYGRYLADRARRERRWSLGPYVMSHGASSAYGQP